MIPLCLSCAYLAFIIGSMTLSYAQGSVNPVLSLKMLSLIVVGYVLGLLTFYPLRLRVKLRIKKKKKAAMKVVDDENTFIENLE